MNEENLKEFKRKYPLRDELEEKYSGGDIRQKSNWVNQKDWRSPEDQDNINKAFCFYAYPKFAMDYYKQSDLEWLIYKGFIDYNDISKTPKLIKWFLDK